MSYVIRYNFSSPDQSSKFSLSYKIFKNNFTDRWIQAVQFEIDRNQGLQQGLFYGNRFLDEVQIREELQKNIDTVNSYSTKAKPWLKGSTCPNMSHGHLMEIHDEFENTIHLPEFNSPDSAKEMVDALLAVNILIHRYEEIFKTNKSIFQVDVLFKSPYSWHFNEDEYSLFSPDQDNGFLYLDYGVTGVPILNAYHQKVKQRPVPQYNLKAGATLYFGGKQRFEKIKEDLKQWLHNEWSMDINDPKLAIGHILLGELMDDLDVNHIGSQLEKHKIIESVDILDALSLSPVKVPFLKDQMNQYIY